MAILNFPNTGLVANVTQYIGDNGTTYTWDGVKWVGRSTGVLAGAQIQSDWTQATGTALDFIKNKPTLATVATSGSYADLINKPALFSGSYTDLSNRPNLAGTYQFSVAADDSTQRVISTDEVVKFIGAGGITTASDTEGNITITGSGGVGATNKLVNGVNEVVLGTTGTLTLANAATISGVDVGFSYTAPTSGPGGVAVQLNSLTVGIPNPTWAAAILANLSDYHLDFNGGPSNVAIAGITGPASGTNVYTLTGTWAANATGFPITIASDVYEANGITKITSADGVQVGTTGGDWTFGVDGALTLPAGGVISEGGGLTGAIKLTPAGGANAYQALVIYPTAGVPEGDHLHLTTGAGTTELYLGNDAHYVKLVNGGNVEIQAFQPSSPYATAAWTFGTDGNIDTRQALGIKVPNGVPSSVTNITMTTGSWELNPLSNLATTGGSGSGLTVTVTETGGYVNAIAIATAGTGYTAGDVITVVSGTSSAAFTIAVAGRNNWTFGTDGKLTAPGNLQVNGGKIILNTGGNAYVESVDYGVNSANSAVNIFGGPYQKIKLRAGFGTEATWTFGTDGTLTVPGDIQTETSLAVTTNHILYYSNQFSGSQSITINDSAILKLGDSTAFTIEAWIYETAYYSTKNAIIIQKGGQKSVYYATYQLSLANNTIIFNTGTGAGGANTGGKTVNSSTPLPLNQWVHVAVVWNGATITMYQNGVSVGTTAANPLDMGDNAGSVTIGTIPGGVEDDNFVGKISNLRIVKNTAVYTGAFTPPTAPLAFVLNTSLLTCNAQTINVGSGTATVVNESPFGVNGDKTWTFGIDGTTVFPDAKIKGYVFTATNAITNYIPQQSQFFYTDNNIIRLVQAGWYIKGPGLVGWKQITSVQDNSTLALIMRIGSGNTPLGDGSEFPAGGGNVYTISQYLDFDLQVADKTWRFDQAGSITFPDATVQTTASIQGEQVFTLNTGAITYAPTAVDFNLLFVTAAAGYSATNPTSVTLPNGVPGQRLVIFNGYNLATLTVNPGVFGRDISSGVVAEFIYSGFDGLWMPLYGTNSPT